MVFRCWSFTPRDDYGQVPSNDTLDDRDMKTDEDADTSSNAYSDDPDISDDWNGQINITNITKVYVSAMNYRKISTLVLFNSVKCFIGKDTNRGLIKFHEFKRKH